MPDVDIDVVEAEREGFTLARLTAWSARIDSRLRKRYKAPFAVPVPEVILDWLTKIVTFELYLKRGRDPQDPTLADIKAERDEAIADIKEAADAQNGLFDLPLRDDVGTTAITKSGPIVFTETSPYVWTTRQADAARVEDENG